MTKNLIIYYSRKGQNYFGGSIRAIAKGNTQTAVEFIQQAIGADVFEVDTVKPYAADYTACTEEAKEEIRHHARPALKKYLTDISAYENIFVCGPCWWGTFPMAIFSQLEKLNFMGKKVMGLMTHEGSGLGNSERDLKNSCTGATFGTCLAVCGSEVARSREIISTWAATQVEQ